MNTTNLVDNAKAHLQSIANADWSKQYLTSNGEVGTRSYLCQHLITVLRYIPYVCDLFPRTNFTQATTAIKQDISLLLINSFNPKDPLIESTAKKVNELLDKIAKKQTDRTIELMDAMIWMRELIRHPVVQPTMPEDQTPPQKEVVDSTTTVLATTAPQTSLQPVETTEKEAVHPTDTTAVPEEIVKEKASEVSEVSEHKSEISASEPSTPEQLRKEKPTPASTKKVGRRKKRAPAAKTVAKETVAKHTRSHDLPGTPKK